MNDKKHTPTSDAEEARIQKMIASDPDAPEVTDDQIAKAKPFSEAFPALAENMRKNVGGRPRSQNPKVPVSIGPWESWRPSFADTCSSAMCS